MRIIEPSVELYRETNPLKRIERVARVCTASKNKITETSARPFCEKLLKMGHMSPFEHARVIVPNDILKTMVGSWPYGADDRIKYVCEEDESQGTRIMNARDFIAFGGTLDELETLENAGDYATVLFTVDIGISRELLRHRQMSFMEQSTRYVNLKNLRVVRPLPFEWASPDIEKSVMQKYNDGNIIDVRSNPLEMKFNAFRVLCDTAKNAYNSMLVAGCPPQEARSVLPLSTATKLYVTGMFDQWRDVLKLRTAPGAHPSMQYIMKLLLKNPNCPQKIRNF